MKKRLISIFVSAITIFQLSACSIEAPSNIEGTSVENSSNVDATKKDDKVNKVIEKEGEFGFNLPLVIINTNGTKIEKDIDIFGEVTIYNSEEEMNYLSDIPELESDARIKMRGSSSKHYPKKQFNLELLNSEGEERDERVLGMSKDSDWIFNAPFADKSLMRNYLAYNVTGQFMEYTPKARFCEVFIIDDGATELKSNHYKGVYVAIEKIKRNDERVDISKTDSRMEETSFIAAKDRVKEGDIFYRNYGSETYLYDYRVVNSYPKDPTPEQKKYITKAISEFERVLYSDKFKDSNEGYSKYIDVDTFVDYYIVNEFFKNTDAGILSTYFYKDLGDKIKAGPIWDFNVSMGNYEVPGIDYLDPTGFYMAQASWFDRLLEDKAFVGKVVSRYKLLRKTYLRDESLIELIDAGVNKLGDAINRNFYVWPIWMCNQEELFRFRPLDFQSLNNDPKLIEDYMNKHKSILKNTDNKAQTYEEEISMLKKFITKRGSWMDENIESLFKFTK